jgi:hypothetical protein
VSLAGITEVLDLKGLREGMNRRHISKRARRLMTNWQIFYFSQQALYKRGRDLNIKNILT